MAALESRIDSLADESMLKDQLSTWLADMQELADDAHAYKKHKVY